MQIRNYSPRTIDTYLRGLTKISPDEFSKEQIKSYIQKRIDSGNFSTASVNQLISALKILMVDVLGRK